MAQERERFRVSSFEFRVNPQPATRNPKRSCRGQGTLEYILVLAAVIVAVIVAANAAVRPAVNKALVDSSNLMQNATGKLANKLGLP